MRFSEIRMIKKTAFFIRTLLFIAAVSFSFSVAGQHKRILIHSHNDYRQVVPFYLAYSQYIYSIEADVFGHNGKLLVAHDLEELDMAPTFEKAYIDPLVYMFRKNNGKPWLDKDYELQLMVELKSGADSTLPAVAELLAKYPDVFDPTVNPNAVKVVITGNVPKPGDFNKYPEFISFDGILSEQYTPEELKRVALFSTPFFEYSLWNGKGSLTADEKQRVNAAIANAHSLGKPIRFWASPDGITAWNTFHNMGVDIINTDRLEACAAFFNDFENKNFSISESRDSSIGVVATTDRLDKITSGFSGFDKNQIQLTSRVPVYEPNYECDGRNKPVKNVIFLIGDGMGLAQVNAAASVNKGLTIFNMNHIGLQTNSAKDAYTTDSAAGGSALATGQVSFNRHISMSETGKVYPSITDLAVDKGMSCGVVTLGNIADATPAAFYAHSVERDYSDEITTWLLDGKLDVLAGSGMDLLTRRLDKKNLAEELKKQYRMEMSVSDINKDQRKVICIDERMDLAATQSTIGLLAEATRESIKKLSSSNGDGFFLMVEGAKIDYAGHANSLPGSIVETLSFDLAVAEALKFADGNGETLVIVTADHETGGLTLIDGNIETGAVTAYYVTDDHTPIMLPVYAYGPRSGQFCGVYRNTEIFHKIKAILGL